MKMRFVILALASLSCVAADRIAHVAGGQQTGDGLAAVQIKLVEPFGVAFGPDGDWYICEYKGQRILRVDKAGMAHVFAGSGLPGYSGDGGPATQATFRDPHGIVITRSGRMYVADTLNHVVRLIDLRTRQISTVAGSGSKGFSGDDGPATKASFDGTFGIALNPENDKLYIADLNNRRVRMVDLNSGKVQTIAGNGENGEPADGAQAARSPLVDPRAVAVDSKGNVYILERRGNALRVVDRSGLIRTVIRPGSITPDLNGPKHLCVDRNDNVIIADAENHLIRRFDPRSGRTETLAGSGSKGQRLDPANPLGSELNRPHGVIVEKSGALYISDSYNHRVLKLTSF